MQNTEERVVRVQLRIREMHRKKENWQIRGFSLLSGALVFMLVGTFYAQTGGLQGTNLSGLFGAMLLHENAGGYVLVAAISFIVAIVITIFGTKYRNKKEKNIENQEDRK